MTFVKTDGKTAKISVPDIREDVTATEVKTAMEAIIDENVFNVGGVEFIGIHEAKIIRTEEETLELV